MSNSIIIHQPQYIWPNYGLLSHILNSGLDCVAVSLLSTYAKPPPIRIHYPQYIWPNYGLLSHTLSSGLDCEAVSLLSTYAKPPPSSCKILLSWVGQTKDENIGFAASPPKTQYVGVHIYTVCKEYI
jgi:hypothetical protein